jgi:hypothetical protein
MLRMVAAYASLVVCAGLTVVWIFSYNSVIISSVPLSTAERFQVNSERRQLAWSWHRRFPGEVTGINYWRAIPFKDPPPFYFGNGRRTWPPQPSLLGFVVTTEPNDPDWWRGVVPHWFPILIFGLLAAVFAPRTAWRFGIRHLLILTTLMAILLTVVILGNA